MVTYMLATGSDLKVVQKQLGHSTIAITANVYAHVIEEVQKAASDRVSDLFFGSAAG